MKKIIPVFIILFLVIVVSGYSEGKTLGIHAGAGTDIHLGLGIGAGASYLLTDLIGFDMEVAAFLFYSYSVDIYTEYGNHYTDTSSMFIFAVLANWLFNYMPIESGIFFVAGGGAMATSIDWQGSSPDDMTWNFSRSYVSGGFLANLGLGWTFGNGFELRIQTPVFIVFRFNDVAVAPMFVLLAGYRF